MRSTEGRGGDGPDQWDSKNPGGPALLVSASQWHTFIQGIKLSTPSN